MKRFYSAAKRIAAVLLTVFLATSSTLVSVLPVFAATATTGEEAVAQLKTSDLAAALLDGTSSVSTGDRLLAAHDRLAAQSTPASTGDTALDVLENGSGTSEGYARAMAALLDELGVENSLVTASDGQMWNEVLFGGSWYHISVYLDDQNQNRAAFLKSDSAMASLLGADASSWTAANACTSTSYDAWKFSDGQGSGIWKNYTYTILDATLYGGTLTGTSSSASHAGDIGLAQVDALAAFQNKLYLVGRAEDSSEQKLYTFDGFYSAVIGSLPWSGSVTETSVALPETTTVFMAATSTGLTLVAEDGTETQITLHTHTEGEWTTVQEMDCASSTPGKKTLSCTDCGVVLQTVYTAPSHTEGEWTVAKEVSCTEAGEKTLTCSVCGEVLSTEEVPALGHTEGEWAVLTAPTADAQGVYALTCSVCGAVLESKALSYGDLNLDSALDVQDVMLLAESVAGSRSLPDGLSGNFGGDDTVDVQDVMALAQMVAG